MPPTTQGSPASSSRRPRWLSRVVRAKLRPLFSRRLSKLAALIVPAIYMFCMRLVWATSRVHQAGPSG